MYNKIMVKSLKKIISSILATTTLALSLSLFGCAKSWHSFSVTFFGTSVFVQVKSESFGEQTKTKIRTALDNVENSLSLSKPSSALSRFNSLPESQPFVGDEIFNEVLQKSLSLYSFTEGKYNPAVYPIVKLWKLTSDTYLADKQDPNAMFVKLPEKSEQENLVAVAEKFSLISFDGTAATKPDGDIQIDFGGIGKGYAADLVAKILQDEGYTEGYVNLGGSSIYILGIEEDLSVVHPRNAEKQYVLTVDARSLTNSPLSTSGDYQRYYVDENGKYYSHIIDPETGAPANTGFQSVTVIGKSACECDAVSTALCAMRKEDFISFVKTKLTDCKVFAFYEKDGEKLFLTNEKQSGYTLLDQEYSLLEI